jgi:hypothetical protein
VSKTILPNGKAYDAATGGAAFSLFSPLHCCVCGKPVGNARESRAKDWLLLTRAEDGRCEYVIGSIQDASLEEIKAGLWIAPIGPDCLKQHPELEHGLLP